MFSNTNKAVLAQQQEIAERIAAFYRVKYPASTCKIEQQEKHTMTPEEIHAANEAYTSGAFQARQKRNADLMSALSESFKARPKL